MRGVFDGGLPGEAGEGPDARLDGAVIAALEHRQYIRGDLFGISACLRFVARYGAVAVAARELPENRVQFALSGAAHWQGFDAAPVTLTFDKALGAKRGAARKFLDALDANALLSERSAHRRLVALGDGRLVL